MGPDGSLYVVLFSPGAVYRFTPTDRSGPDCPAAVPSGERSSNALLALALAAGGIGLLARKPVARA
jgi:hypothetical protein